MANIIDFKSEIMDKLKAADTVTRINLQAEYNRKYKGVAARYYVLEPSIKGPKLIMKTSNIREIIFSETGYGLFIVTDRGTSHKVHPSTGLEILSNETVS